MHAQIFVTAAAATLFSQPLIYAAILYFGLVYVLVMVSCVWHVAFPRHSTYEYAAHQGLSQMLIN